MIILVIYSDRTSDRMEDSEGWQDSEIEERSVMKAASSSATALLAAEQSRGDELFNVKNNKNLLETFVTTAVSVRTVIAALRSILSGNEKNLAGIKKLTAMGSELDETLLGFLRGNWENEVEREDVLHWSTNNSAKVQRCLFSRLGLLRYGQYLCVSVKDWKMSTDDDNADDKTGRNYLNREKWNRGMASQGACGRSSLIGELLDMLSKDESISGPTLSHPFCLSLSLSLSLESDAYVLIVSLLSKLFNCTALLEPHVSLIYDVTSYHFISYNIISHHIISYHIISYHIVSYHITSCHIVSYYIISHQELIAR